MAVVAAVKERDDQIAKAIQDMMRQQQDQIKALRR